MRPLRNFKPDQCCHLISRIANRAFFLNGEKGRERFRARYLRRMWNASEFMKTLKQDATMSYNGRRVHTGTIWESRFRVKTCEPDEKATLMNMAGYIDRNPVKAKTVRWPDKYAWCSFAAACKGDRRCIDGYRFIYSVFAPLCWERIREMHEKSIHLVLNMSDQVPHLLEKGSDKVACDVLKQLADGPKRPNELRAAVGIASANYFTARYLTPLAEAGYIAVEGGEKNRYAPDKRYKLLRKGKAVADA